MGKTNYELTLERMPAEFLKYDQRRMIDGFHLEHDAAYLYLPFLARRCRVGRQSGVIEWAENGTDYFPGGFEDSMTVYDLLCCAKGGAEPSGRFCRAENLPARPMGPTRRRHDGPVCRAVRPRRRSWRRPAGSWAAWDMGSGGVVLPSAAVPISCR